MSFSLFDPLRSLSDARLHPGVDFPLLDRLKDDQGIILPEDHRLALHDSNGAEIYDGYVRLFGVNAEGSIDAVKWNDENYWKFAWNRRCSEYWCFAETAWGDQYAYQTDNLRSGDIRVYFLDYLSMTPTAVASSFSEFVEKEFVRSAKDPYDKMIVEARHKFGKLEIDAHLVYFPSILLGGEEDIAHVQKMNARSAMVCNGDIAIQLDAGLSNSNVKAVTPYEDASQRMRLQIVWSNPIERHAKRQ